MAFGQFEKMILIVNNCVKNVPIRIFSGPYFPAFGLNMERYSKFWVNLQVVVDVFWREEYFSDPVHSNIYKQRISFFYHISSFPIAVSLLLHCFHPQTSFVVSRCFHNGDTGVTLALHKSWFGPYAFLSVLLYL